MSIKAKLLTIIFVLFMFIIGLVGINFYTFNVLHGDAPAINLSGNLRFRAYKLALLSNQYATASGDRKAVISKEIGQEIEMYDKIITGLAKGDESLKLEPISDAASRAQYDVVKPYWEKYKALLITVQNETNVQSSDEQINIMVPDYVTEVNKLVNLLDQSSQNKIAMSKQIQVAISLLGFGVVLLALFIIVNKVIRPIRQLAGSFAQVATGEGDLTVRLDDKRRDEIGEVTKYFNVFIENVQKNHKSNLLPLCDACHIMLHDEQPGHWRYIIRGYRMTSNGPRLDYEKILNPIKKFPLKLKNKEN